jgi:adenylate cyclase
MSDEGPARLLAVDDVPANVRLLEAVLTHHGYAVVAATDARAALDLVASAEPDLVLLDVVMPEIDGYALCRRLREREDTAVLPVIMVTSSSGPGEDAGDRSRRRRLHPEAVGPARAA